MKSHHVAWLEASPSGSRVARRPVKDGFDIHHMDGDHDKNDPANLVLIEHADHMMLHGMDDTLVDFAPGPRPEAKRQADKLLEPVKSWNSTDLMATPGKINGHGADLSVCPLMTQSGLRGRGL